MFIVIEMQTNNGTTVVAPLSTYTDLNVAYQKYYTVLAAAAVSSVECHTAVILTETGQVVRTETFAHTQEQEVSEL